MPGLAKRHDVT